MEKKKVKGLVGTVVSAANDKTITSFESNQ